MGMWLAGFGLFASKAQWQHALWFSFLVFALLPLALTLLFGRFAGMQNIFMRHRSERHLAYMFGLAGGIACIVLLQGKLPALPHKALLGATLGVALTGLINVRSKISAHAVGSSGAFAALVWNPGLQALGWPLLAGGVVVFGVCWARLALKAHSLMQVVAGVLVGFGAVAGCCLLVLE
jgi:membrane-associated phospholipid phosphatase